MNFSLLLNKLRWRYGNRWASYRTRREDWEAIKSVAGLLLMLFLAYSVVAINDARSADKAAVVTAKAEASKWQQTLIACLNGQPTGLYSVDGAGNQTHISCDRAWDLKVGKP